MTAATFKISPQREPAQPRILIADDQQDVLDALRLLLKGHGYSIETVNSPADLLAAVGRQEFDILLIDLNYARDTTSGREGLDVLSRLREIEDAPPVVAMTGWATVGLAVEAMQFGVSDFVEKPWTNTRLLEILSKQIGLGRERRESRRRAEEEARGEKKPCFICRNRSGRSPKPRPSRKNSCRAKFLKCRDMKSPARGNRRGWSAAIILTFFRWTKKHWESASPTWLEKACPPRS